MTALTNTAIERLLPGEYLKDDRVPGLQVRCNAGGRSFLLYYRFLGQPRRPKIGDYGVIGISDARTIARALLAQVAAGKDPSRARQDARAEETVTDLWGRAEQEHYCRGKPWDREAKRLWKTNAEKALGNLRIGDVRHGDVARWHAARRATPTDANRTLAVVSKLFDLAIKWELRETNPCSHVDRFKERSRKRYASTDELAKIGPLLDRAAETDPRGAAFLYLLLYSGARPSEIERATWGQLESANQDAVLGSIYTPPGLTGVLRIPEGKTGHRDVFLPSQAMAMIGRLPAGKPEQRIVGIKLPRKLWAKIRKAIGCPDLWARDLRRTFATVGFSNDVPEGVVGALLGHQDPKTTKIYAKLMEDRAFRASAQIANEMSKLLNKESENACGDSDSYLVDL